MMPLARVQKGWRDAGMRVGESAEAPAPSDPQWALLPHIWFKPGEGEGAGKRKGVEMYLEA